MFKKRNVVLGIALFLISFATQAWALRCGSGTQLVTVGEVTSALLSKCGKPMMVEPITKSARSTTGELTQISAGERWTYKQGVGKFLQIVIVNNGVVVSIENGPRQ